MKWHAVSLYHVPENANPSKLQGLDCLTDVVLSDNDFFFIEDDVTV